MLNTSEILRLRVLLCFLKEDGYSCSVTDISRTLNEEKYTVSRMLIAMEQQGLIDRSDKRHPFLTAAGKKEAEYYEERINITLNHLMYEGVDIENAYNDALHWSLYNSDETMGAIRDTELRYRVKYELRDEQKFSGARLCEKLEDGVYRFPFLIYREHVKNGSNLSMANEGFEHPCVLQVKDGVGTIHLRAVGMVAKSGTTGNWMHGKIKNMKYFDSGNFISAERNGDIIFFPAGVLNFVNVGSGIGQILHGSVCLKMQCSVGPMHMPESTAIFTILI